MMLLVWWNYVTLWWGDGGRRTFAVAPSGTNSPSYLQRFVKPHNCAAHITESNKNTLATTFLHTICETLKAQTQRKYTHWIVFRPLLPRIACWEHLFTSLTHRILLCTNQSRWNIKYMLPNWWWLLYRRMIRRQHQRGVYLTTHCGNCMRWAAT